jgi:hypothetical protein
MKKWIIAIAAVVGLIVVGVLIFGPGGRTAQPGPGPNEDVAQLLDRAEMVRFNVVNETGGPCKVRIEGQRAGAEQSWDFDPLAEGASSPVATAGPLTIKAIEVSRDGEIQRHEPNVTLKAGSKHTIRIPTEGGVQFGEEGP